MFSILKNKRIQGGEAPGWNCSPAVSGKSKSSNHACKNYCLMALNYCLIIHGS